MQTAVIASKAKQSKNVETRKFPGLLRRYAPQRFYVDGKAHNYS